MPSNDEAILKMLAGANFGPNASLTLPSGQTLDAAEAQAMTSLYAPSADPVRADLSAVQLDDRLLDALGSALPGTVGHLVDDELNALMLAWRNEAETEPFPPLVDVDTAITVVTTAARTWWNTNTGLKIAALVLLAAVILTVALTLTALDYGGTL